MFSRYKGFSIIELIATITILAILAAISAPNYGRIISRDAFRAEGQDLFDRITDARNAAITNKKCNNGSPSTFWKVVLKPKLDEVNYQLFCVGGGTDIAESSLTVTEKTNIINIDFNESSSPDPMGPSPLEELPPEIVFSFLSNSAQGKLEQDDLRMRSVKMVFTHNAQPPYSHTICFNRIAGFPTFNKSKEECQT